MSVAPLEPARAVAPRDQGLDTDPARTVRGSGLMQRRHEWYRGRIGGTVAALWLVRARGPFECPLAAQLRN